jgi:cobalt-zinc-cadmium efflux system protein
MPARHHHAHGPTKAEEQAYGHAYGGGLTPALGRAFMIGIALNLIYVAVEAFFGIAAHSLALLADAGHNLGDVLGLVAAGTAAILVGREPTTRFTYGLGRSTVLAALGNAIALLVITGGIGWEAVQRLMTPEPTGGATMIIVAGAGIAVNGATALLFMAGRRHDLNIRGAFWHMASDALVALGVAIAGGLILLTGWQWLDPATSLIVSAVIVVGTWQLLREALHLSLDAVPPGIDPGEVETYLSRLPGVVQVHDLHIWGLSTTDAALTVHLVCAEGFDNEGLVPEVSAEVRRRFRIGHATIQLETANVAELCELRPDNVV